MTTTLKPAPVSTRQLFYVADEKKFLGDISDVNGLGRVYADSCDEGLTLVSHRTGREVVCVVTDVAVDAEDEILYWTLAPVDKTQQFVVVLFND